MATSMMYTSWDNYNSWTHNMRHQSQEARCQEKELDARKFSGKAKEQPWFNVLYVGTAITIRSSCGQDLMQERIKGDTILIFYVCLVHDRGDRYTKMTNNRKKPQAVLQPFIAHQPCERPVWGINTQSGQRLISRHPGLVIYLPSNHPCSHVLSVYWAPNKHMPELSRC